MKKSAMRPLAFVAVSSSVRVSVAPGVGDENARRGRCFCHGELRQ
jgi:hypothetical protein